jgi:Ni/Fe-hydrogenase subunit HybB-like protein
VEAEGESMMNGNKSIVARLIGGLSFWKVFFVFLMIVGLYVAFVRYFQGLGAATNLSDNFPWGLWIGFDLLVGVGLAAGGFVIAATVHIFHIEKYEPIARPTILTAFLGYLMVIVALLFDLGQPWRIWHAIIMWNPHSVMFEVGWCVMLYTTVLALEFSPVVFERLRYKTPLKIIHAVTIPLVIAGVILSSLHQSSLGSLYLIVPEKIYPLWYSSNLPYLFFVSAVAVGPAMVIIESFLSSRAFGREIELPILSQIAKITAVALSVYLVLKIEDVVNSHLWPRVFTFNLEGILYWVEIGLGVLLPIILIVSPRVRSDKKGLFVCALLVVLGFVMNRLNLAITSLERNAGTSYFPSWMEISITLMIVTLGFAAFRLAVRYLPIFPGQSDDDASTSHAAVAFIEVSAPKDNPVSPAR